MSIIVSRLLRCLPDQLHRVLVILMHGEVARRRNKKAAVRNETTGQDMEAEILTARIIHVRRPADLSRAPPPTSPEPLKNEGAGEQSTIEASWRTEAVAG